MKDYAKYFPRNGRLFDRYLRELEQIEKYSFTEIREFQESKLRKTVRIAYAHVPFYRKLFDEKHLTPSDIRTVEDLQKLPLIYKSIVRDHFSELRNTHLFQPVFKGYTSGTTGTSGIFLRDLRSINLESASIARHQQWANVFGGDKRVVLRGERVVAKDRVKPPFWRYNRFTHQLIFSSYHLSEEYLPEYVRQIETFSPRLLEAYPSTAYVLARYLEKHNLYLTIPIVHTSSEPLYPHWRRLIQDRLKASIFDWYGMAERVIFAGECEKHEGLHLFPSYGITEIVSPSGDEVNDKAGILVGTTLDNYAMPLIRYRTNDFATRVDGNCLCGRCIQRIEGVEGKTENFIVTPDGRYISPSLITFCFNHARNIEMSQVVQHSDGHITIKLIRAAEFAQKDADEVIAKMKDILGQGSTIKVEYVSHIPRTQQGKFQWILSEMEGHQQP